MQKVALGSGEGGRGGKWMGEVGEVVGVRGVRVEDTTQPRLMRGVFPRARGERGGEGGGPLPPPLLGTAALPPD